MVSVTPFKLHGGITAATRLPSEAFYAQCAISFESDETPTFRQWRAFENIGLWASDCYHHDGADVWSAIREMNDVGVPDDEAGNAMRDDFRHGAAGPVAGNP